MAGGRGRPGCAVLAVAGVEDNGAVAVLVLLCGGGFHRQARHLTHKTNQSKGPRGYRRRRQTEGKENIEGGEGDTERKTKR